MTDAGPGRVGGGDQDGPGDHQLVPGQLTTPQPQPGIHTPLQEGTLRTVQDTPHFPGHHTEHRSGKDIIQNIDLVRTSYRT